MHRRVLTYHPLLGHLFIPNLRARIPHEHRAYIVRTNAHAFRSERDYTHEVLPDKRRVLVFGDSFTAADGVSNPSRFSDRLEALVPDLEVFNFALPGSGTDQQYMIYETLAKPFSADLILLCPLIENIRRNIARYRLVKDDRGRFGLVPRPWFRLREDGTLERCGFPVPREWIAWEEATPEILAFADLGGDHFTLRTLLGRVPFLREWSVGLGLYHPYPHYERDDDPAWRLMKAILQRWIEETAPLPVILAPLPTWHWIETNRVPDYPLRFQSLEDLPRVRLVDLLPAFRSLSKVERRACRFKHDIHLTVRGHEVVARALAPVITSVLETFPRRRRATGGTPKA